MSTQYTVPAAPAGWYLSDTPSEGALVVPLYSTEQDVADALADGWRPLLVSRYSRSTGRGTVRTSEWEARPMAYSNRIGGGWRQGGLWVQFATPRTPEPEQPEPAPVAVLLDEPTRPAPRPQLPAWLRDAQADAARRDRQRQAGTRPAWLYGAAAGTEGAPTPEGEQLADDAPDTTPRPAPDVFVRAQRAAARWLREHEAGCVRCATNQWSRCPRGEGLARRAEDAQQAADGALAVVADRPDTNR